MQDAGFILVKVGAGLAFSPQHLTIGAGQTVRWEWSSDFHNVVSGDIVTCVADGLFCSPSNSNCASTPTSNQGTVYERTFDTLGTFPYFCAPHCSSGMTGSVTVQ